MRKLFIIALLAAASTVYAQDYARNYGRVFEHSSGRGTRYAAQAETVWVNRTLPWFTYWTVSYDSSLATGRVYVALNGDTARALTFYGSTGGGETYTTPGSMLARFYLVWTDSTNRPFRFFGW